MTLPTQPSEQTQAQPHTSSPTHTPPLSQPQTQKEKPLLPVIDRKLTRSEELWIRAAKVTPAGTQCYSHGPTQFVGTASPKFIERGKGCTVWDVDGNEYIDLTSGGYPSILGFCYEPVNKAVQEQMNRGTLFPMMHRLEVETAELMIDTVKCAEVVRFGKNGSDVTAMAVRAARAYTKKEKILCCGYHGIHDWYIATTSRNDGIPKFNSLLTHVFDYNDIERYKALFDEHPGQIAAVIMEAVQLTPPKDGFLQKIKSLAHDNGAVLIFDEVITGFRFALGGAQEYFGVTPDLACFGKSMSNGYPLSALVGRDDIMREFEKNTFFSSTYGGETTTLAAGKATITEMRDKKIHPFVWAQGEKIKEGFNKIAREHGMQEHVECIGYPCWSVLSFKDSPLGTSFEKKSLFQQEGMKRGLLTGCYHGPGLPHTDEIISKSLEIYDTAIRIFKQNLEKVQHGENIRTFIEGEVVKPVFRPIT
jgi:glutamate-1-semialdehyde 2,1-aminomutase